MVSSLPVPSFRARLPRTVSGSWAPVPAAWHAGRKAVAAPGPARPVATAVSAADVAAMSKPQLQAELRLRNQKISGLKHELQERLLHVMGPTAASTSPGAGPAPSSSSKQQAAQAGRAQPQQQQQQPGAAVAAAPLAPCLLDWLSEAEAKRAWDSVPRCLLSLGGAGVQASHGRSLRELVAAHGLVKVKLNGPLREGAMAAAAAALAESSGGMQVQAKGNTMLFALGSLQRPQLMELVEQNVAELRLRKQRGDGETEATQRGAGEPAPWGEAASAPLRPSSSSRPAQQRRGPPTSASPQKQQKPQRVQGRQIDDLLGEVAAGSQPPRGEQLTRQALQQDWERLAGLIVEEESREAAQDKEGKRARQPTSARAGKVSSAGPPISRRPTSQGGSRRDKAPWRKQAAPSGRR